MSRSSSWCSRLRRAASHRERVAERAVRALVLTDPVPLREALDADRGRHQIVSAKRGSERPEVPETDDEERERHAMLTSLFPGSVPGAEKPPLEAADHAVIGFSERSHCHFSGSALIE